MSLNLKDIDIDNLKNALRLQNFRVSDWGAECIILTIEELNKKGDQFSLEDVSRIETYLDDKYKIKNEEE